ncbi:malate dehydrogenase (quinone) [Aureimonas altamirensis]|uniref:malate dehydrogenase (quinone) n=1 Tax=Aureimonas altamirensis TaxID=370622 RepID=UPI0020371440|nr:malate dehydrogenase (quinone) [Aureimonas altamirensis]MCM2502572.1 malate dehydrogenase (quinone) [Aureimonas altamirensis]
MEQGSGNSRGGRSGLLTISRRQLLGGAMAGAAVATLPACAAATVEADRTVDVALIGGGVMSATLGALLRQLEPGWTMEMFERLDGVGLESSNAWHNAGTGHSALCELNYTPEDEDGNIDVTRAVRINESFQISRQFWSSMIARGVLDDPRGFINATPHMSFVWGAEDVDFLRRRHAALVEQPLFAGMRFSTDPAEIHQWAPLLIEGRDTAQPIAATWSGLGTDVDFGALTRQYVAHLQSTENFALQLSCEVEGLERNPDGTWKVIYAPANGSGRKAVNARSVFIGAGGAAILLLQESAIPESRSYGGFPVGGSFLVNRNPALADRYLAKAYGKAASGAPPMSVPHLDTRVIDGERALLFGPFATFSTNFLMEGSRLDLLSSIQTTNIGPMVHVGLDEFGLVRYLVGEVLQSQEDRIEALRAYFPDAIADEWTLVQAGQRVQIIDRDESGRGDLEFGTRMVVAEDGSIAALLGASPGGSTAPSIMLDALQEMFPDRFATPEWQATIREIVPSFGTQLNTQPDLFRTLLSQTNEALRLELPDGLPEPA